MCKNFTSSVCVRSVSKKLHESVYVSKELRINCVCVCVCERERESSEELCNECVSIEQQFYRLLATGTDCVSCTTELHSTASVIVLSG